MSHWLRVSHTPSVTVVEVRWHRVLDRRASCWIENWLQRVQVIFKHRALSPDELPQVLARVRDTLCEILLVVRRASQHFPRSDLNLPHLALPVVSTGLVEVPIEIKHALRVAVGVVLVLVHDCESIRELIVSDRAVHVFHRHIRLLRAADLPAVIYFNLLLLAITCS